MRTILKVIGTVVLVMFGTLASASAMAAHGGRGYSHGYGHGYGYGGGVRFGISLGYPLYGPGYYYPPYYAYPPYAYPAPYGYPSAAIGYSSPPAYVEQGVAVAPTPSQAQGDWYFCAASNAYYPDVKECPAGWQRVPAQTYSR